jgi:hypothetical protein
MSEILDTYSTSKAEITLAEERIVDSLAKVMTLLVVPIAFTTLVMILFF